MKNNKDGASNFLQDNRDRFKDFVQDQKKNAEIRAFGEEGAGIMAEKRIEKANFAKFNTASQANTNPFANASALRADTSKQNIDALSKDFSMAYRDYTNTAPQDILIDGKGDTSGDLAQNDSPQTILPVAGPPMSNGTGSSRPNFEKGVSMNIKKVNDGASMSEVLFNKK